MRQRELGETICKDTDEDPCGLCGTPLTSYRPIVIDSRGRGVHQGCLTGAVDDSRHPGRPEGAAMTDRPTPEELAAYWGGVALLRVLREHGYVIVHPDDVQYLRARGAVNPQVANAVNSVIDSIFPKEQP